VSKSDIMDKLYIVPSGLSIHNENHGIPHLHFNTERFYFLSVFNLSVQCIYGRGEDRVYTTPQTQGKTSNAVIDEKTQAAENL